MSSEKDAVSAQKLDQLQPFIAVLSLTPCSLAQGAPHVRGAFPARGSPGRAGRWRRRHFHAASHGPFLESFRRRLGYFLSDYLYMYKIIILSVV